MIRKLLLLACLLFAAPAEAEWLQASSRNFNVYSSGSERQLREFVEKLERLHFVMRTLQRVTREPNPNRLNIYLMRNIDAVRRSFPFEVGGVNGYYENNARGPIIVGTRGTGGNSYGGMDPEAVLLHEYAHHFMFSYFPATYPTWYVEGFAEFWGSTQILPGNVVEVGHLAQNRFRSFQGGRWLPLSRILGARSYADIPDVDLIYAEGWLLLRYLFDNRERVGQLERYLTAINAGTSYEEAMNQAFGPGAEALNNELRSYAGQSRFSVVRLPFRPIEVGTINIRPLSAAEEALIGYEIQLGQGLIQRFVPAFVADVRRIGGRFPNDPYALGILAEAEKFAGNHAASGAAADRLLQIQPDNARALMHSGLARIEALRAARSADRAAWTAARQPLERAVRLARTDPLVLEAYYDSFTAQGVLPPVSAQNGLFEAVTLAPGDNHLRWKLAHDFERRRMIDDAIAIIRPAALAQRHRDNETEAQRRRREAQEEEFRPAGQPRRETAREMLQRLEQARAQSGEQRRPPAQGGS
jgi:hypothetical protein